MFGPSGCESILFNTSRSDLGRASPYLTQPFLLLAALSLVPLAISFRFKDYCITFDFSVVDKLGIRTLVGDHFSPNEGLFFSALTLVNTPSLMRYLIAQCELMLEDVICE